MRVNRLARSKSLPGSSASLISTTALKTSLLSSTSSSSKKAKWWSRLASGQKVESFQSREVNAQLSISDKSADNDDDRITATDGRTFVNGKEHIQESEVLPTSPPSLAAPTFLSRLRKLSSTGSVSMPRRDKYASYQVPRMVLNKSRTRRRCRLEHLQDLEPRVKRVCFDMAETVVGLSAEAISVAVDADVAGDTVKKANSEASGDMEFESLGRISSHLSSGSSGIYMPPPLKHLYAPGRVQDFVDTYHRLCRVFLILIDII